MPAEDFEEEEGPEEEQDEPEGPMDPDLDMPDVGDDVPEIEEPKGSGVEADLKMFQENLKGAKIDVLNWEDWSNKIKGNFSTANTLIKAEIGEYERIYNDKYKPKYQVYRKIDPKRQAPSPHKDLWETAMQLGESLINTRDMLFIVYNIAVVYIKKLEQAMHAAKGAKLSSDYLDKIEKYMDKRQDGEMAHVDKMIDYHKQDMDKMMASFERMVNKISSIEETQKTIIEELGEECKNGGIQPTSMPEMPEKQAPAPFEPPETPGTPSEAGNGEGLTKKDKKQLKSGAFPYPKNKVVFMAIEHPDWDKEKMYEQLKEFGVAFKDVERHMR